MLTRPCTAAVTVAATDGTSTGVVLANAWFTWHDRLAVGLIIANAIAGAFALVAHVFPMLRRPLLWVVIGVAQAFAFAQAITGAVLMARFDREPASLHALYGFSAVIAVGILYSYRTASWMKGKQYLLYGLGCLFIMGLGLREVLALS